MSNIQFTTDGLIKYFEQLLKEANNIDAANCADDVECWWIKVTGCCKRMGKHYEDMLSKIKFHSGVYVMGVCGDQDRSARISGFQKAQKRIHLIIEDLKTFGFVSQNADLDSKTESTFPSVTNNLNINQNLSLSIKNYPPEVQPLIINIKNELQKDSVDKSKIGQLLTQLSIAGIDILKEILLRGMGI